MLFHTFLFFVLNYVYSFPLGESYPVISTNEIATGAHSAMVLGQDILSQIVKTTELSGQSVVQAGITLGYQNLEEVAGNIKTSALEQQQQIAGRQQISGQQLINEQQIEEQQGIQQRSVQHEQMEHRVVTHSSDGLTITSDGGKVIRVGGLGARIEIGGSGNEGEESFNGGTQVVRSTTSQGSHYISTSNSEGGIVASAANIGGSQFATASLGGNAFAQVGTLPSLPPPKPRNDLYSINLNLVVHNRKQI